MEPAMITIVDADPEVTLSIEDVDEGAEDMTVTVTATAAGPMPGIFEIPASAWDGSVAGNDGRRLCLHRVRNVDDRP